MRRTPDPTRRQLLGGALGLAAAAALVACGGDDSTADKATGSATPRSGPWSWTDDLGQKIELDKTPVRIAAYGDAGAALWHFGIVPVAIFAWMDPAQDDMFDGLDLSKTEVVGKVYGEISVEQLAAARPDLIIATSYDGDTPDEMYGFKDKTQLAKIKQIAPVLAVAQQTGTVVDIIGTNERLATSLGYDTGAGSQVADDRAAFEQASSELTAAAKSGLTAVPIYADDDGLYCAKAPDDPALKYYAQLGVTFTEIGGKDNYWEILSWENADRYEPDMFLNATRQSYSVKQLGEQPTFAKTAAYRAGQVHEWRSTSMDYPSQTAYMKELADWLTTDKKVV